MSEEKVLRWHKSTISSCGVFELVTFVGGDLNGTALNALYLNWCSNSPYDDCHHRGGTLLLCIGNRFLFNGQNEKLFTLIAPGTMATSFITFMAHDAIIAFLLMATYCTLHNSLIFCCHFFLLGKMPSVSGSTTGPMGDASEMVALSGLSAAQHRRAQAEAAQERQQQKRKRCRPSCGCLFSTIFVTLLGTAVKRKKKISIYGLALKKLLFILLLSGVGVFDIYGPLGKNRLRCKQDRDDCQPV